jgi:hypothetical protein
MGRDLNRRSRRTGTRFQGVEPRVHRVDRAQSGIGYLRIRRPFPRHEEDKHQDRTT